MLNNVAKPLERLILVRLSRAVTTNSGLAGNQFGFCKGKGTVHTIEAVMDVTDAAAKGVTWDRDLGLMVTLGVRNAFNIVPWNEIDRAV